MATGGACPTVTGRRGCNARPRVRARENHTKGEKQKENTLRIGRDTLLNLEADFENVDCPYYSKSLFRQGQYRKRVDDIVIVNTAPRAKCKIPRIELSMMAYSCQLPCSDADRRYLKVERGGKKEVREGKE